MDCKRTNPKSLHRGLTLVEMMVGIALGLLLLAAVATLYIVCLKSFASMTNYAELNGKNRFASDLLTRDIRNAAAVTDLTTNQLILHYPAGDVTYTFDGGTLTRSQSETNLLLSGITSISFSLYQRWTSNQAYEVFPPATPATAKLVGFEWTCLRPVYGSPLHNSLTLQGAIVKLRNK